MASLPALGSLDDELNTQKTDEQGETTFDHESRRKREVKKGQGTEACPIPSPRKGQGQGRGGQVVGGRGECE